MKTTSNAIEKARIYHTLAQMISSFSSIVRYCDDLQQAGALTCEYRDLFQGFTQELQAEMTIEVLQMMDSIEHEDWFRFGIVREKWEKYLRFEDEDETRKKSHKGQRPSPQSRTGHRATK